MVVMGKIVPREFYPLSEIKRLFALTADVPFRAIRSTCPPQHNYGVLALL